MYAHCGNNSCDADKTYKHVVAFSNCFHGRTIGATALTSKVQYIIPFKHVQYIIPFKHVMCGETFVEYGNGPTGVELIRQSKVASVFVEPIQEEWGIEHIFFCESYSMLEIHQNL